MRLFLVCLQPGACLAVALLGRQLNQALIPLADGSGGTKGRQAMKCHVLRLSLLVLASVSMLVILRPSAVAAPIPTVGNPVCPGEEVFFNPDNGEDIVVPSGYQVSVFATGLNFPTGIAFQGNAKKFKVYVLESGHGLPSRCNDQ